MARTRATTICRFAVTETAKVRAARKAAILESGDDVPANPDGVTVARRW